MRPDHPLHSGVLGSGPRVAVGTLSIRAAASTMPFDEGYVEVEQGVAFVRLELVELLMMMRVNGRWMVVAAA